ncbi:hypothetical protein ENSA5_09860 [Enhygromyxa salina]|uniref:Uncharacterized protein n=1 Tax=Enhygromyxa salina TaxID=215803 RepID=A0A2S9YGN3_9BACT|nr:hypothetical protein [Enhygromyxa salina]PRQ04202.1 hypothetical protein ENSA5_09860 [Enhygromyxa salina]
MNDEEALAWWLAQADNANEWARLREALALSEGFALLLVIVPDARTERHVELMVALEATALERDLRHSSPLDADDDGPLQRLTASVDGVAPLAVLTTTEASRRDPEALERCFAQLNSRRDQLVTRLSGPLVLMLRLDALRQLGDVAPDLFSVHAAQFRFATPHEPRDPPPWLLLPFEAVGALGIDPSFGPADRSGMPSFIDEPPALTEPLIGRDVELELIADRILAGARRIGLSGKRSVGRAALARAALERTRERWDRVVWVAAPMLDTTFMVLHAIVAELGDEGELPPVHEVDLEHRYRQLTGRQRVFLVVDDLYLPLEIPEPSPGSLLIEIGPERPGQTDAIHLRRLERPGVDGALVHDSPIDTLLDQEVEQALGAIADAIQQERQLSELEKRLLHLFSRAAPELEGPPPQTDHAWRVWQRPGLLEASVRALAPPQRTDFLDWWHPPTSYAGFIATLQAFTWDRLRARLETLTSASKSTEQLALLRLLTELRPPHGTRTAARRALHEWEASGGANELSKQLRAELHLELGVAADDPDPPLDDSSGSLVRALRHVSNCDDTHALESLHRATSQAWERDEVQLRHLAWSGLAWLHIHHFRPAEARAALAEVEASARAWATPFALLRLRLLHHEHAIERGDLLAASADFDAIYERCEQLFGQVHAVTITVLARGVEIFDRIAQAERAHELADDCWRQLQYVETAPKPALQTLAAFFAEHGRPDRAQAIRERREQLVHDHEWPLDEPT